MPNTAFSSSSRTKPFSSLFFLGQLHLTIMIIQLKKKKKRNMVSSIINKISFLESCLNSLLWKLAEITANQCNKMVMICSFLENVAIKSFCVSIMFLLIDTIQKTTHITIVYEKKHSCFSRQKTKCS